MHGQAAFLHGTLLPDSAVYTFQQRPGTALGCSTSPAIIAAAGTVVLLPKPASAAVSTHSLHLHDRQIWAPHQSSPCHADVHFAPAGAFLCFDTQLSAVTVQSTAFQPQPALAVQVHLGGRREPNPWPRSEGWWWAFASRLAPAAFQQWLATHILMGVWLSLRLGLRPGWGQLNDGCLLVGVHS